MQDLGGMDILLNILETDDCKCKIASLQVLKDITDHPDVRKAVFELNGVNVSLKQVVLFC